MYVKHAIIHSLPNTRAKSLVGCELYERCSVSVDRVCPSLVPPPCLNGVKADCTIKWVLKAEEDHDCTNRIRRVEAGGKDIIVFCPPGEVAPTDDIIEDEANDHVGDIVERRCGREEASSREDNGEVHIFKEVPVEFLVKDILDEGSDGADEEEVCQAVVELSGRELACGADNTPDDGGSAEYGCIWAGETALRFR